MTCVHMDIQSLPIQISPETASFDVVDRESEGE